MFGSLGWPEIILLVVVILLIFGVGRITKLGGELGSAIRAFKDGLNGEKKATPADEDDKKDDPSISKLG